MPHLNPHIAERDTELVEIIHGFTMLRQLSWSKNTMRGFMKGVACDNIVLPKVSYAEVNNGDKISQLEAYLTKLGTDDHPAITFLRETAQSYLDAHFILRGIGTKDVSEFSQKLYGTPSDVLEGYGRRHVDVARYILRIVEEYKCSVTDEPLVYNAAEFKKALSKRIAEYIPKGEDSIAVTVDSDITARAAAGSSYVKIRKGARFSKNDLEQLFHHEVMIHTLTYINGRKQPLLKTLGYNAPRTTATQEGLAVFAEYINLSIELVRLKRIALRILAIDMAGKGADFIEVYRFFGAQGQNNEESYYSAMRIFRGGDPKGGIVFYKDNVYLRGLIEVGVFFKRAMHEGFLHDIELLFCGKLTTDDVRLLKPLDKEGAIMSPVYMPEWAKRSGELAAHLALNDITERFKIKD